VDSPDKYCYTMPDGECVSEDPRCPHNQGIIVDEKSESVDEYLDREDLNRMEWDRLQEDLHPHQAPDDESRPPRVHRDTDAVQHWLRAERRKSE